MDDTRNTLTVYTAKDTKKPVVLEFHGRIVYQNFRTEAMSLPRGSENLSIVFAVCVE